MAKERTSKMEQANERIVKELDKLDLTTTRALLADLLVRSEIQFQSESGSPENFNDVASAARALGERFARFGAMTEEEYNEQYGWLETVN
jgi:hypothetical protein